MEIFYEFGGAEFMPDELEDDCPFTDAQLTCRHERLCRIMTLHGIAYRCESPECEMIFDDPDPREPR